MSQIPKKMLFAVLFFLSTANANVAANLNVGDACDFQSGNTHGASGDNLTGDELEGCNAALNTCAPGGCTLKVDANGDPENPNRCVTKGGTQIVKTGAGGETADMTGAEVFAAAGCTANAPFKNCTCQKVDVKKMAGSELKDMELATEKCYSELAFRYIVEEKVKLPMSAPVQGKDPTDPADLIGVHDATSTTNPNCIPTYTNCANAAECSCTVPNTAGSDDLYRSDVALKLSDGSNVVNGHSSKKEHTVTKGICGIPKGEFCIVKGALDDSSQTPVDITDYCMPGLFCYRGFNPHYIHSVTDGDIRSGFPLTTITDANRISQLGGLKADKTIRIAARNGICMDQDMVNSETAWFAQLRVDVTKNQEEMTALLEYLKFHPYR